MLMQPSATSTHFVRHLPEILAVRVRVYQALEKWELMQAEPIEAGSKVLTNAYELHPDHLSRGWQASHVRPFLLVMVPAEQLRIRDDGLTA